MKLKYFVIFFRNWVIGRKDYSSWLGSAGNEILVLEIEEADGGEFEEGCRFDELILILSVYVEDIDILIEKQQC